MTTTTSASLSELLAEHTHLHSVWKQTGTRRVMAAAWEIGITPPGAEFGRARYVLDPRRRLPTDRPHSPPAPRARRGLLGDA